jgi:GNAT superfamily N-acetyltransferase
VEFRAATPHDARSIAELHADSWRRHYRGAYTDAYLDGDLTAERHAVWAARMAAPAGTRTVLAVHDGRLAGFVHVVLDDDPRWGSLVDNLHVRHDRHRGGVGTALLARAAEAASPGGMYLWVLHQNTRAQAFYEARGGVLVESGFAAPPGGDPAHLHGAPGKYRMHWAA